MVFVFMIFITFSGQAGQALATGGGESFLWGYKEGTHVRSRIAADRRENPASCIGCGTFPLMQTPLLKVEFATAGGPTGDAFRRGLDQPRRPRLSAVRGRASPVRRLARPWFSTTSALRSELEHTRVSEKKSSTRGLARSQPLPSAPTCTQSLAV